ncbi:peptidylprolyl isomerase [Actinobacillus pleuropneumoniae]|uniref:Peptidylprolyl isomerase n=2 Tax=Actinobacillus pleuropneumoniae TaxID=715 RepID=A0A448TXK3_ACTPL|nr:peptidylprolyl isomerase [Actinobacillus pleuropneumoniae]ACE61076.1 peptidyl-prolyl cis-trans isomerase SurA [Actinobacillus pleuropneumoniae serovar 7 str. AP76]EFL78804.1 survival SurA-like protein [Actinobacillus pleuropneumoniae serovar 2 str. 4226]EFM88255.1 Survival protein SurA-like protein [Actinobacillus pleuropneumoniae serovar 2 str. S1536]EFM96976.1 Survival protein SurA-like protein [Actinobacillus pleuropneumoniae serovar 10 str. D13039]EFN03349.1 Survival protein SurA-like p
MKLISAKSLLVALVTAIGISQTAIAIEERVVALVDGVPVMESQVQRALGKKANSEANHKAALEQIIDDLLVQKAVKEAGVKVNYAKVDQVIEDIAARNGITYGQLLDALDYQGITLEQYRQQIAQQMAMEQVRHISIGKSIQVDPKDVHAYAKELLEKDKANGKLKNVTGVQHRVSHILIKTTPVLNDIQAKAKLAQIVADIKAGKTTFEEAAKANSVDYLSAADGGDLGYNFLDIYDPAFAKAASTAKQEQITAPFKSQFGWHILKVTGTQQGDRTEDAYNQRAYEQLVDKQAQEAAKDWVKALRKTADVQYVGK